MMNHTRTLLARISALAVLALLLWTGPIVADGDAAGGNSGEVAESETSAAEESATGTAESAAGTPEPAGDAADTEQEPAAAADEAAPADQESANGADDILGQTPTEDEITADLKLLAVEVSGATVHFTPELRSELKRIAEPLKRGLATVQGFLESPGLPTKPNFWLVTTDAELTALLKNKYPAMGAGELKAARVARAYMRSGDYYLTYKPGIARARLMRLIFNEFALLHLRVLAAGGPENRVAWFHTGMAAYLAWQTEGELNRVGQEAIENKMLRFYARNFDPARAHPLQKLEKPEYWAAAVRADYKSVYAQAAQVWMYFARRSGASAGPVMLRSMATGESFADAFLNATDVRLGQFEREVQEKFYPEIVAERKRAADATNNTTPATKQPAEDP